MSNGYGVIKNSTSFDCEKAATIQQSYFATCSTCTNGSLPREQKYAISQQGIYCYLNQEMDQYGLNVKLEGASFDHIKSMIGCFSDIFCSMSKCAVFVTLHGGIIENGFYHYYAHNIILAKTSQIEVENNVEDKILLFDCCGIELSWTREKL
ncbi:hypothetical protein L2734_11235 [Parashewanella spongiae]|uniref:hypothetical protein n=1 Tax=Parashewanella spongiae TaxID=342950 RepID=UPI00105A24C6|nr:hypothetical protein [Parashewanella spongiae]MCL1078724.1 hypothetical protein [Parashewanella spongiae]